MPDIQTILTPVDFTAVTEREVEVAVALCRSLGARLVLHHNEASVAPGLSRAWDWKETHRDQVEKPREPQARLQALLNRLADQVPVEAKITRGAVVPSLLTLARELPADLLVVASHGATTDDHQSVAEKLVSDAPCPVLTLLPGSEDRPGAGLPWGAEGQPADVLVPTDFGEAAGRALQLAFALAARFPLVVHLLHVVPQRVGKVAPVNHTVTPAEPTDPQAPILDRLWRQVPDELVPRTRCYVEVGDPATTICALGKRLEPSFLVMGQHTHALLHRWLTRDTSQAVLHQAQWPVLYVP